MRTLDEVIEAERHCIGIGCQGCPYDIVEYGGSCECSEDALHYLETYRQLSNGTSQKLRNTSQITCPKCHSEFVILPESNNALTWDELKQMVGKPVWVESLLYKQWAVIAYVGDKYIRFEGANLYAPEWRTNMGEDGWQAYRKEREE